MEAPSWSAGGRRAWHQRAEECRQAMQRNSDSSSAPESPKPRPKVSLPLGFKEVAACLQRSSPPPAPTDTPPEARQPEMLMESTMMTMYATHIVQDEATGVTYMDTVTTSVGRVALRNPCMAATFPGPTVEELTEDLAGGCP